VLERGFDQGGRLGFSALKGREQQSGEWRDSSTGCRCDVVKLRDNRRSGGVSLADQQRKAVQKQVDRARRICRWRERRNRAADLWQIAGTDTLGKAGASKERRQRTLGTAR
jgi:hypothetical protein